MVNSFKHYLAEEEKTVHFTFGKMNPPNIGHGILLDEMSKAAANNTSRVYLTQSFEPLDYTAKIKHTRKMFPRHARDIMVNKGVNSITDAMTTLYNEGFRSVVLHTSKERLNEYTILLNKYNGVKGRHGLYKFKNIKVVESVKHDPDASTTLVESATSNDYNTFHQSVPHNMTNQNARALFNDIRKGHGLSEEKEYKNHVQLEPVSPLREAFVNEKLFDIGEEVYLNKKDIVGIIESIGTNYLVVESKGERWRCWIDDVSKLDPKDEPSYESFNESVEDKDIGKKKGSQPAKYHSGLAKSTKSKRDAEFKKAAKKHHKDPSAYPDDHAGDDGAKTKVSKHTKKYRDMFGEDVDLTESAALKAKSEKSGIPVGILKQVYNRGMAAWRTGHRPGASQQQWAMARVNSFITKGSGTWGKADKDLAAKVKKESVEEDCWPNYKQVGMKKKNGKDVPNCVPETLGKMTKRAKQNPKQKKILKSMRNMTTEDAVEIAKKKIDREKEVDAKKHDRMLDMARLKRVRKKNMKTK